MSRCAAPSIRLLLLLLAGAAGPAAPLDAQSPPPAQPPAWNEVPLAPGVHEAHDAAPRTDTVDVPVGPGGGEIEYMVRMRQGDALVYAWQAIDLADPSHLTSEFHGHTDRAPGTTGTLVFYRKATGGHGQGSLIAPFDGTHGWYLKNDSPRALVVRVTLTGYYQVIPDQIPER